MKVGKGRGVQKLLHLGYEKNSWRCGWFKNKYINKTPLMSHTLVVLGIAPLCRSVHL